MVLRRAASRGATPGSRSHTSRWWYRGIIIMVVGAVASYAIPLSNGGPTDAASAPIWRYVVQPHIDSADSSWSGHGLRLLLTAAIWCLGGALLAAVRAVRTPTPFVSRWLIGLSVLSNGLSVWILIALNHQLGDGMRAPGAVLACVATGAAVIGTLSHAGQWVNRSA
jgi:hypothetical protein